MLLQIERHLSDQSWFEMIGRCDPSSFGSTLSARKTYDDACFLEALNIAGCSSSLTETDVNIPVAQGGSFHLLVSANFSFAKLWIRLGIAWPVYLNCNYDIFSIEEGFHLGGQSKHELIFPSILCDFRWRLTRSTDPKDLGYLCRRCSCTRVLLGLTCLFSIVEPSNTCLLAQCLAHVHTIRFL